MNSKKIHHQIIVLFLHRNEKHCIRYINHSIIHLSTEGDERAEQRHGINLRGGGDGIQQASDV